MTLDKCVVAILLERTGIFSFSAASSISEGIGKPRDTMKQGVSGVAILVNTRSRKS